MPTTTRRALAALALFASLACSFARPAPAQIGLVGGIYVTTPDGLFRMATAAPYGGTTLVRNFGPGVFEGVIPNRYNTGAAFLDSRDTTSYLLNYQPQNQTTSTLVTLSNQGPAANLCVDQDGQYVVATSNTRRLLKTSGLFNNRWGTLFTGFPGSGRVSGLCIDDDTGDYVVSLRSPYATSGMIVRIDRNTRSLTTIARGITEINSIDHDQVTGRFVITRDVAPDVMVLNRDGSVFNSMNFVGATGAIFDDVYGRFGVWRFNTVEIFGQNMIRNLRLVSHVSGSINHCGMVQGRKLACNATTIPARRGSRYSFFGRFPDSAGASYVVGLGASGLRPQVQLANRLHVNVTLDPLFFATAAGNLPFYTTNFIGTLNNTGAFSASFVIPNLPASLETLTIAAAAINPNKLAGIDIAPSLTVRLVP